MVAIAGDLVGDGSWFEPDAIHPTWEWADLVWWYAAPVAGLGFTDNSVEVTAIPTREDAPAAITVWPDLGDVPLGAAPRPEYVTVPDPSLYTALAFRAALADAGIAVRGGTRATTDSLLFREVRGRPPLAEVASRPLRDWIFPILSTSQNWFAEMLLKQLGRGFGAGGSWREGLGVTPAAFVRLLAWMRRHPSWPVFSAGFPVAGKSGSLRTRLRDTPLAGRVIAKTGSLTAVNSLSGYLERPRGGPLIFSIQANHHTLGGRGMIEAIDSLLVLVGR